MPDRTPRSTALRRLMRHLKTGLMYAGAGAWTDAEINAALRAAAGRDQADDPDADRQDADHHGAEHHGADPRGADGAADRVTPYAELPDRERRLFLRLEEQMRQEDGR